MPSRRRPDPAVRAELDALDAALREEREDPEAAMIAAEVRSRAAAMSPEFAARLDAAAARGFAAEPTAPAARPARPRLRLPRPPLAVTGLAATAAVALIVVAVQGGPAHPSPSTATTEADTGGSFALTPAAHQAAGGVAAESAVPPGRRVQRGADLTVATPIGRLQDTADAVGAIADRVGGFVAGSSVSASGDSGQATFDLRVPAARADEALAALARLGHVRSRSETSTDVTRGYDAAAARLHDALAERQALLRALAAATTQPAIDSLHARLDIARGRIAAATSALHRLALASDHTRIGVTVLGVPDRSGATAHPGGPWTPRRALRDALRVLSTAAGVAIVAAAGAVPALLLALACALALRAWRRRRREQALAGARGLV